MVQSLQDHRKVNARFRMERITMTFKATDTQEAELNTLLEQQQDPSSPNFHRWISPEEFADRFGISTNDMNQVVTWLRGQGFTVNEQARNRRSVTFTGSAGQVETTFRTPIHEYVVDGKTFYANVNDPYIPDAFSDVVMGFRSLNNFHLRAHGRRVHINDVSSQFTSNTSNNHFVSPRDFATIYGLTGLYASGFDGAGQKIAVMGQVNIDVNDIRAFRAAAGLPLNDPEIVLVPGSSDPGNDTGDQGESDLDLEWAGAVAKSAHIIFVTSNDGAFDALQYAIDQNLAPVISISYGDCEKNFSPREINILASLGQQANAQGMTIVAAAGDSGAADCDYKARTAIRGLAVDVPASLPYVTGMGGTTFREVTTSWAPVNDSSNGSALSYIPETTWNDSSLVGTLSASGGGRSIYFSKPSWQAGIGVPNDQVRDVPDIALNSSSQHDGYLMCSAGSCVTGFRSATGGLSVAGGTSVAAPAFAGIVAILNEIANAPQGNINPSLYKLASTTPSAFHDVTTGGNQVNCRFNSVDCGAAGTIGYSAGSGYDLATGLGSIDGSTLLTAWAAILQTPTNPAPTPTPSPAPNANIPQPISDVEGGNIRSGYVVITPDAQSVVPSPMATFGIVKSGVVQSQAGILPASAATTASLLVDVNTSIGRNLAFAIVNPADTTNVVTLTLLDSSGGTVATTTLSIPARQQVARFVSELFPTNTIASVFSGSLRLQSQASFFLLGLRFAGIEFSTLPLVGAVPGTTPQSNSITLPQFAIGGSWASAIALVNTGTTLSAGRIDIYDTNGNPMSVKLNNTTQSTFQYSISPGGIFILAPRDVNGLSPL